VALALPATVMTVTLGTVVRGKSSPLHSSHKHDADFTSGSDKQAAASWGAAEGEAELKDEQAGDAIAKSEKKEALAEDAAGEEPAEPEDKSVSYAEYLIQQAEKKLNLDSGLKPRSANEGSKADKKWADAKPIEKEETDYFAPGQGKNKREREKKVKQTVDFDPRFVEPERTGRGGARGGGRGGRGGRGGERGGERGQRGNFRGGRGGRETIQPINTKDTSAFPSLGGN
jgi:plasminogen activator inhibitor 1 RNA-binding protein